MTDVDERQRWLENTQRDLAQRAHDREAEFFKTNNDAAIKSGEEAVKALILINGGSSVAMLAFVGTLASKDQQTGQQLAMLAAPLIWFASGVGLAVAAAGFSYFTNRAIAALSQTRKRIWEHPYIVDGEGTRLWQFTLAVSRVLAICFAALSLASFVWGVWTAKQSFERLPAAGARHVVSALGTSLVRV